MLPTKKLIKYKKDAVSSFPLYAKMLLLSAFYHYLPDIRRFWGFDLFYLIQKLLNIENRSWEMGILVPFTFIVIRIKCLFTHFLHLLHLPVLVNKLYFIPGAVSYTHLRAHETVLDLVCRLLLEKKKK